MKTGRTASKPPGKPKATNPKIVKKPKQKMAVVVSHGDPNVVGSKVFPALYGAVYKHKFALKKAGKETFKVEPPRARWPDAHLVPKDQWTGIWGIPIPSHTRALPQPDPEVPVKIEMWDYGGTVGEILHIGPYSEEPPTIQRLHEFIAASGYEIAGAHEEEYLTRPEAKEQKTIIRYPVRKVKK
ncbi:MAG: GyrI-like domain-containing protein [Chloroflexi bacterium]|nr:GyrI-like domain-containing protein [Chloroflexota bacterium]